MFFRKRSEKLRRELEEAAREGSNGSGTDGGSQRSGSPAGGSGGARGGSPMSRRQPPGGGGESPLGRGAQQRLDFGRQGSQGSLCDAMRVEAAECALAAGAGPAAYFGTGEALPSGVHLKFVSDGLAPFGVNFSLMWFLFAARRTRTKAR